MKFKSSFLFIFIILFAHSVFYSCINSKNSTSKKETEQSENSQIRVMTYNIHHGNPPDTENIDLDAIAEIIKKSNADLIALQELDSVTERSNKIYQLEYLAQKLNMEFYFFRAIPYQGGTYGVGVLSKFPISQAQNIKLPKMNDVKSEDRIMGMVRVELPGNQIIYFASTHWDVVSEENRVLQAEKVCQEALQLKYPFILAGDLNTKRESESMNVLINVFTEASEEFEPTIPVNNPTRKIDHIVFVKSQDFSLVNEEVIYNPETRKASDHLPFWVDLMGH